MTEWRRVPGFESYEVSDTGLVRSFHRGWSGRPLSPHTDAWGYLRLQLFPGHGEKPWDCSVHELVALAFIGPRPADMVVRHLDGDPQHNVPSNLAYGTVAENAADTVRMGRSLRGQNAPVVKLTEAAVHAIRRAYVPGVKTMGTLAAEHGVTRLAVHYMLTGRTWGWLKTDGWSPIMTDMRVERHRINPAPRTATGKFKVTYGLAGTGRES